MQLEHVQIANALGSSIIAIKAKLSTSRASRRWRCPADPQIRMTGNTIYLLDLAMGQYQPFSRNNKEHMPIPFLIAGLGIAHKTIVELSHPVGVCLCHLCLPPKLLGEKAKDLWRSSSDVLICAP